MHNLTQKSTILELTVYDFQISLEQPGQEVAQAMDGNPLLPGVILTEQGQYIGMISRRRFLEQMSRPYGLELFLKRPLRSLHRFASSEVLMVTRDMLIVDAAHQSLQRSPDLIYEPLVVQLSSSDYRLLDAHELLRASSEIHKLTTQLLESANTKLQRLASLDGLTKLANRRLFDSYLDKNWRRLASSRAQLSLIMCDVDYFKLYNDTYGHQAGDSCLQQIAKAISRAVRRTTDLVARYGGEEFSVILPNTDLEGALSVAKNIRDEVKNCAIAHSASLVSQYVTLSLGVASTIPAPIVSGPNQLIAAADAALYEAKQQGRDRAVLSQ
ncbi:MAG: GGDEF domain-containing protein [Hormoscilla sp.]